MKTSKENQREMKIFQDVQKGKPIQLYLIFSTMPGHVAKSSGPDPDPAPWLEVLPELKDKLKSKPYDAKKSCWVPDKATGGYLEGLIESTDGDKVTVKTLSNNEVRT